MTSQKGAQLRWGSNEALPRALIAKHAARGGGGGQPLHCHTAGAGPRTERLRTKDA